MPILNSDKNNKFYPKNWTYAPSKDFWHLEHIFETNDYGLPILKQQELETDVIEDSSFVIFQPYNYYALNKTPSNSIPHFFIEDYKFESYWSRYEAVVKRFKSKKYKYVCSPDFSIYLDMPFAALMGQLYRIYWYARYLQENFLVIPPVTWGHLDFIDVCLSPIINCPVVAMPSNNDNFDFQVYDKIIEIIKPKLILVFSYSQLDLPEKCLLIKREFKQIVSKPFSVQSQDNY